MMNIKKYIFRIAAFASITAILFSCTLREDFVANESGKRSPIINTAEGAVASEILIKFNPSLSDILDEAFATKGGFEKVDDKCGVRSVDDLMAIIGGYKIERVFPVDRRHESRTRENGLHLWYVISLDETMNITKVANELSCLGEISKIEYSKQLKKTDETPKPASFLDDAAYTDITEYQWHLLNKGTLPEGNEFIHMEAGCDIKVTEAWEKCTGCSDIIVAVMDEGVMWSHPDLVNNMWVNEDEIYKSSEDNDGNGFAGDVYGYNFVRNTGVIVSEGISDSGHGTHVAGIIAAERNCFGVSGIAGGTGNGDGVKIMCLQIFSGDEGVTVLNQAKSVKYAADNGAVILQCSWGYISALANPVDYSIYGFASDEEFEAGSPLEKEAFDYFIYNAGSPDGVIDGGIIVFAGGNEFAPMAGYPGAYKDYISVAAVAADYTPSTFTNYGPGTDISAPGGDEDYHQSGFGGILSTLTPAASDGVGYGYMEGTSMACPVVSGVAALGLSYAAKLHKHFDSRQYRDLVVRSVSDIDSHLTGEKKYNYAWHSVKEMCPTIIDLKKDFYGQMGSGVTNAALLLENIEKEGMDMVLPNVYVAPASVKTLDLSWYFNGATSYSASVADTTVAEVSVNGSTLRIKGLKTGATTLTVTAAGSTQTARIVVRDGANGNGWL